MNNNYLCTGVWFPYVSTSAPYWSIPGRVWMPAQRGACSSEKLSKWSDQGPKLSGRDRIRTQVPCLPVQSSVHFPTSPPGTVQEGLPPLA